MSNRAIGRAVLLSGCLSAALLTSFPSAPPTPIVARETAGSSPAARAKATAALADLPLAFEPNHGQSSDEVTYLTRAPGWLLQLTATGMRVFAEGHALRWTWRNARPDAIVGPESELPGKVNYLKGSDPGQWRTSIPTYSRVRYSAIYPGIDLVYYGNGRQLEYDLVVAPRSDPAAARLVLEGATATIADNGDVEVRLNDQDVMRMRAPVAYQERHGERTRVDARYRLATTAAGSELSFDVGPYDRDLPLVIDPLVYSTFLGGSENDAGGFGGTGAAIAVNSANEAFVAGRTADASIDFPTTTGALDTGHNGQSDVFVARLNSSGTALIYSTFIGSSGYEYAVDIAVNAANEAFITGVGPLDSYPTTPGAYRNGGGQDAFVTHLNSTGTALIYSAIIGGSSTDIGRAIAVNAADEAFITGSASSQSVDFPTTPGAYDTTHNGGEDVFVTRLNSSGTALVYSTFIGGDEVDRPADIVVNVGNEAFVTGLTESVLPGHQWYPTTPGAFNETHNGGSDVFVTRLNSTGSAFAYSTFLGGGYEDLAGGIALDAGDEAIVSGSTFLVPGREQFQFPTTPGAFDRSHNGLHDVFVTRLNATGTALVYSTFVGGSGDDYGYGLALSGGEVWFTGTTNSAADFPVTPGAADTSSNGAYDVFVTRLNGTGTVLAYSTLLGGNGSEVGLSIAANAAFDAFVVGVTEDSSSDFPSTAGAIDTSHNGGQTDAFVARVATTPPTPPDPPTNLRVTAMIGSLVTFGWIPPTPGDAPSGFQIEGGLGPGHVLGAIQLGPMPSFTIAMPNGSFYMRVRSIGTGGLSAPSNEVLVHVNVPLAPSPPANMLGLVVGTTLDLGWTNTFSGGAPTGIVLDVTGTLSGSLPLGLVDRFSFAGVPPGTYTLSLRAVNASGSSLASGGVTLTFPSGCSGGPQPVTNFVAYKIGTTLFLAWQPGTSGAAPTSYVVHVTGSFVGSVPIPQRSLSAPVPPGIYAFAIAARNACGDSAPTAIQTVTIP